MDLDELQSVRDRERQTDKPQQLRESFYTDVGSFVEQLRTERDRAAERHGSPYADEVAQLTDEIDAAQQLVEDIHERRIGKIVKAASLEAAALSPEVNGFTAEEQALFDDLVADIEDHREDVLNTVGGEGSTETDTDTTADRNRTSGDTTGVDAADVMGTDTASEGGPSPEPADRQDSGPRSAHPNTDGTAPDTAPQDRPAADNPAGAVPARTDGNGSRPDEPSRGPQEHRPTEPSGDPARNGDTDANQDGHANTDRNGNNSVVQNGHADASQNGHTEVSQNGHTETGRSKRTEPGRADRQGAGPTEQRADRSGNPGDTKPGSGSDAPAGPGDNQSGTAGSAGVDIERKRVLVTQDVDTFVGSDARDYDLAADDVVTLPATNAEILVQRDAARQL